ncbi:uncharacterized protein OCT59_004910 [Rhizophagus irregularis]|uniref:uncharacterized protein n=1 Tax=Rhizophagus irregularis TaxID=588596 RepID=UPI003321FC30|nr:hypothetical protein OCT59_004910 [Rhizophagus irregularis]
MDNISVKINDDANKIEIDVDKIEIDVDKNDVDKIFTFDDIDDINDDKIFTFDDERHNGKPITRIEISPNGNYLITYSEEDRSIVGWNVEDKDKVQLKFDKTVKIDEDNQDEIRSLCVSDDKKLCRIYKKSNYLDSKFDIIDMNNKDKEIALSFDGKLYAILYCTFNLKGEFILYRYSKEKTRFKYRKIIWIYSTQTKNNKWECKRFYEIPKNYELISISKYDKVYLFSYSNDYIYEWNINTEKSVKIFDNNKDKNKIKTENIRIFSNEKFNILKVNDKIIVYSIELGIPIASLDINDDIQLYNFMNYTGLFLPSLFYYTPDKEIKYCWNSKYKNWFNKPLFDEQTDKPTGEPTDEPTDEQTKFVFGILNERVWKSKFYENMSKTKVIECETYKHLNVHLFDPYMDTVSTLFQKDTRDNKKKLTESIENLIKWEIYADFGKIRLEVFKKINTEWELISTRIENHPYLSYYNGDLIASSLFNNNDIVILTTLGIFIYTFSENNKSISLNYFYFMNADYYSTVEEMYKKIFSKSTLPLPNYDSFRLNGWASDNIS